MQRLSLFSVLLLTVGIVSCGSGDGESQASANDSANNAGGGGGSEPAAEAPKAEAQPWDASKGTASVTGTIKFEGDPPKVRKVDMGSDEHCQEMNAEGVMDEGAIIAADGGLQNVFVYVQKGLSDWTFTAPSETASLSQEGCTYKPHVLGVQVGQTLIIENADAVTHNIHSFGKKNKTFNQTQGKGGADLEVVFKKTEVFIPVKCDIHGWMNTYIGVVDNPFYAISAADGSFDLGKLPAGTYTIAARHEGFGLQKQEITIGDGESKSIAFSFSE